MKNALMTLTLTVLVLIIPLSALAGIVDILIDPATLHRGAGGGALNFNGKIRDVIIESDHFDFYQNDSSNKFIGTRSSAKLSPGDLADIIWSHDVLPTVMSITGYGIDAGETRIYSPSFQEFGMVKKVLEPRTMLLIGSCLLGIGLFAIKFRK